MIKNNELLKSWNKAKKTKKSKLLKGKMPKGEQDFINKKEPIKMGLKNSSGPENVHGLKEFEEKINKMADDLFNKDINTFMENKITQNKFNLLYENLLNGMSADEKKELGVQDTDELDNDSFDNFDTDEDSSENITITISKDDADALRRILDAIDGNTEEDGVESDEWNEDWDDIETETEDEDEDEISMDSSFGEGIETETVPCEKGRKYMNKAANKVGGKADPKGGNKAMKGKIPAQQEDPEEVPESKGKSYMSKEAVKVRNSRLNAGNPLF